MAWLESHQSLSRHRKTLAVVAALKVDRHKLIGHLHELWWWGLDNADINGLLGHVGLEQLAEGAGWPKRDASRLVDALLEAGFLDQTDAGYVIHDWYEFAGKLMSRRAANRARMREERAQHTDDAQATSATHVHNTSGARVQKSVGLPDQPDQPDRTGPEQTPQPPLRRGSESRRRNGVDAEQRKDFSQFSRAQP
ncbi:MAG TPA: hypothetical protein VNG04_08550 [Candidatus Acidoferrum sp.]|nr:hypothetical protein [Candidatus Acidoferrum sp.]